MKTGSIDFQSIIDKTFKDLSYMRGADKFEREISIQGSEFSSDPWRIGEIFRNLISNAIKYRKVNNEHSQVSIAIEITPEQASIVFTDNGVGINEESLSKIFEMFYRASEQSEGSGLGLYIVKNAVEKLGGQLNVKSKLDEGTTFEIVLPNKHINSSVHAG
ncbi:MAG: ATP-binding protein [Cytophagales bacterium]|nr:ATP-binding protein [Cytophagales bacterium]